MAKQDSVSKVHLSSFDDLFQTDESREDLKRERLMEIPISLIQDFPDHPYKVKDDENMLELVESIKTRGLIQPVLVRPLDDGTSVSYKDIKALMADLKRVYGAVDEETALYELAQFSAKWDSKYPKISQSWQTHWPELSTYFKYPQSVRTLIYTTNSIENFNRQLRKVTKSKSVFPNDDALLKMLYLAQVDITKSGQAGAETGEKFTPSLRFSLPAVCPNSRNPGPCQG